MLSVSIKSPRITATASETSAGMYWHWQGSETETEKSKFKVSLSQVLAVQSSVLFSLNSDWIFFFGITLFGSYFPPSLSELVCYRPVLSMEGLYVLCTMTHTQQRKSLGLNLIYLRSQMCFIWARGCETRAQMIQLSSFDATIKQK